MLPEGIERGDEGQPHEQSQRSLPVERLVVHLRDAQVALHQRLRCVDEYPGEEEACGYLYQILHKQAGKDVAARGTVDAADIHLLAPSEQDGGIDIHKVEDADEKQDGRRDAEYTHIAGITLASLFIHPKAVAGVEVQLLHGKEQVAQVILPQFAVEELSVALVEVVDVSVRPQAEQLQMNVVPMVATVEVEHNVEHEGALARGLSHDALYREHFTAQCLDGLAQRVPVGEQSAGSLVGQDDVVRTFQPVASGQQGEAGDVEEDTVGRHGVEGELLILRFDCELLEDAELGHLLHFGGAAGIDPPLLTVGVIIAAEAGTGVAFPLGEHDIGVCQVGIVAIHGQFLMDIPQDGEGTGQSQCEAGHIDGRVGLEAGHGPQG